MKYVKDWLLVFVVFTVICGGVYALSRPAVQQFLSNLPEWSWIFILPAIFATVISFFNDDVPNDRGLP